MGKKKVEGSVFFIACVFTTRLGCSCNSFKNSVTRVHFSFEKNEIIIGKKIKRAVVGHGMDPGWPKKSHFSIPGYETFIKITLNVSSLFPHRINEWVRLNDP